MKYIVFCLLVALMLSACGSSKSVALPKEPTTIQTETTTPIVKVEVVECELDQKEEVNIPKEEPIEAEIEEPIEKPIPEINEIFNHQLFNVLLKDKVSSDGVVNYVGFNEDKKVLRTYIASLGENIPTDNWKKEDKLAYWMNAYNAMTIDLILRNLPLQSIKDIDKPWNQRLWKLGDKWYNLDEIEHQILRKMDDPRIHFGINCASFSCPPLLNEAFTAEKVDLQLDSLAKNFINDESRNSISENFVKVSKIFNWFAKDFKKNGTLIDFLNKYSSTLIDSKTRIRYADYNWDLND